MPSAGLDRELPHLHELAGAAGRGWLPGVLIATNKGLHGCRVGLCPFDYTHPARAVLVLGGRRQVERPNSEPASDGRHGICGTGQPAGIQDPGKDPGKDRESRAQGDVLLSASVLASLDPIPVGLTDSLAPTYPPL